MKLQISQSSITEFEIPVPSFWKQGNEIRGLLSETDYRNIYEHDDTKTFIVNHPNRHQADIHSAFKSWEPISEDEFMERFNEFLKSISLTPILKP